MKRYTILILLLLFGSAAGVLVVWATGDTEAPGRHDGSSQNGSGVRRGGPDLRAENRPSMQVAKGSRKDQATLRPGLRERPEDSPETIAARARHSSRILELLEEMLDPKLRFDQKQALSRELSRLIQMMGHRVSPDVRERLLEMLNTVDPRYRMQVGEVIGSLQGDTGTAEALVRMLKADPDDVRTRHAIYAALGKMNVREVAPELLGMLGEGRPDEHLIVRTLGSLAGPTEMDALFKMLDKPLRDSTQKEIEKVLTQRATWPGLMDQVAGSLEGAEVSKRRSLLRILAYSKDPNHAEIVRSLVLTEQDAESRRLAIQALGKFGDQESGAVLLELVKSGSKMEQRRAVQAIHTIQNPATVTELARNWKDVDQPGRLAIMGAASRIHKPDESLNKLALRDGLYDGDLRVRTSSARLLGKPGRDDHVSALVQFVGRAKHPSELSAALSALEKIRTKNAAAEAMRALRAVPNEKQRARWMKRFEKIYDLAK